MPVIILIYSTHPEFSQIQNTFFDKRLPRHVSNTLLYAVIFTLHLVHITNTGFFTYKFYHMLNIFIMIICLEMYCLDHVLPFSASFVLLL